MWIRRRVRARVASLLLAGAIFCPNVELTVFAAEVDAGVRFDQTEEENTDSVDGTKKEDGTEESKQPGAEEPGESGTGNSTEESGTEREEEPAEEAGEESDRAKEETARPEDGKEGTEEDEGSNLKEAGNVPVPDTVSENTITVAAEDETAEPVGLRVACHTQEEIRDFLLNSSARMKNTVTYAEVPEDIPPYVPGVLSERTQQSALAILNQVRYIAGLSYHVELDETCASLCQAACLVNSLNGEMTHDPKKPEGIEEDLYQLGASGARSSNLGLGYDSINQAIIRGWMDDSDESNIQDVGHRRFLLNPMMGKTGFGYVGRHSAVYAHDGSGDRQGAYDAAWPAQNMPLEYFSNYQVWSVSLEEVDVSGMWVKLTRKNTGEVWNLAKDSRAGDFYIGGRGYGISSCIIFRPDGIRYQDGDEFEVEIKKKGETCVRYTVNFFSIPELLEAEPPEPEPSSRVVIEDKSYDGKPVTYTGEPVVTDLAGNEVSGVGLNAFFAGTLADGSIYEKSAEAPAQAGNYRLLFEVAGDNAEQYRVTRKSYVFRILPREVCITAKPFTVEIGGKLPTSEEIDYTVSGLLDGDELIREPSFRFDMENISTGTEAVYAIVPYDAEAGPDYTITYINGTLMIGEVILESGTVNNLSWKIDKTMKLTITGSGDYGSSGRPPWANKYKVLSAVVEVTDITSMHDMFSWCISLKDVDLSKTDTSKVTDMSNMFYTCSSLAEIDLGDWDTGRVENMSGMFYGCSDLAHAGLKADTSAVKNMSYMFNRCRSLKELDLSGFDTTNVDNMAGIFTDCNSLTHVKTPKNCSCKAILPANGTWYRDVDVVCEMLPQGLPYSIDLYRDRFPSDGKKSVYISGVDAKDRIYDKTAVSYADTAALIDSAGTPVSGVVLAAVYTGALADGSPYRETTQAPSQAGIYTLTFRLTGDDAGRYVLRDSGHQFRIRPGKVTITAPDRVIRAGSRLPDLSEINDYEVSGLLDGDRLAVLPSFRYGTEEIATDRPGSYEIIPYGADAGSNYEIEYVNAILRIVEAGSGDEPDPEFGDIEPDDIPEDGIIPEGLWIAGLAPEGYTYTGKALKPAVRVYEYKTLLREKRDYIVSWTRNVNVYDYGPSDREFEEGKAPVITVKGKGNYIGRETQPFRIKPVDIGEKEDPGGGESDIFAVDSITIACNGKEQKPLMDLLWNGRKLKNGKDYTIAYYEAGNGRKIDFVREAGFYQIELTGTGNFTGTRKVGLRLIDPDDGELRLVSGLTVAKIPAHPYADGESAQEGTGVSVKPPLTVKDKKTVLKEGIHYKVTYCRNTAVGTACAVVTGIEAGGYSGTKRVAFKITGTPISKAVITGLPDEIPYDGMSVEPKPQLTIQRRRNGERTAESLKEGRDYKVRWQKNEDAGTAEILFTGMGGYTGTLKKSFKIKRFDIAGNEGGRFEAVLEGGTVKYARGGAKPKPTVTFRAGDGKICNLTEGKDYTLSYEKNRNVTGKGKGQSSVTVKGKGNFSGTYGGRMVFEIDPQNLNALTLTAQDRTYKNKRNNFATRITVTDLDGIRLRAGIDYDKDPVYTYRNETEVFHKDAGGDGRLIRSAGERVDQNDVIPAGTILNVKVTAKAGGNYMGELEGQYRITLASIASASVSVRKQIYTGQEITPDKSQFTVKVKGRQVDDDQWEIVEGSYRNNIKKGTASVAIRGLNDYGGIRTVKFSIGAKGFLWWWRK